MKLSIIIPVYNEEKTLLELLKRVEKVELPVKKEIIIVDDGSKDNTRNVLEKLNKHKIFYHEKNKGKGAAIKTALKYVTGDIIIIQDADLEYNPEDYNQLIKPIVNGDYDVVYGSRFLGDRSGFNLPSHYWGNKILTFITVLIYGKKITDMETCYKVIKKEVIKNINIRSDRFNFEPEITSKILKKGYKIKELPINYVARSFKDGKKLTLLDGIIALWSLIKYRFID